MSELIGTSLDNASEHHSVINVIVGVQDQIQKIRQDAEDLSENQRHKEPEREITKEGPIMEAAIKEIYKTLKLRNKEFESQQIENLQEIGDAIAKAHRR
jgi:uncharacterized membrane protein YcaP (DUF421 family)